MTPVQMSYLKSPAANALSTSEVARQLGVSVGTIRRWSDLGQLESLRAPSGSRRFTAAQLRACLDALEQRPVPVTVGAEASGPFPTL